MQPQRFRNRPEAGRRLAEKLAAYANRPGVLVLALPRGGVPVSWEVARSLGAPLDVFLVRKLGVPGYEELAMGAVATGGVRVLNDEIVRGLGISEHEIDAVVARELRGLSRALLGKHVARRPSDNPVARFGQRFAADLPWLTGEGLAFYHAWAFATVRQLGAAFELAALHLEWLGDGALAPAATAFSALSTTAKAFILKAARAVNASPNALRVATFSPTSQLAAGASSVANRCTSASPVGGVSATMRPRSPPSSSIAASGSSSGLP